MTKELRANSLKVIAIIAMTIDHLAWVGIETYEQAENWYRFPNACNSCNSWSLHLPTVVVSISSDS